MFISRSAREAIAERERYEAEQAAALRERRGLAPDVFKRLAGAGTTGASVPLRLAPPCPRPPVAPTRGSLFVGGPMHGKVMDVEPHLACFHAIEPQPISVLFAPGPEPMMPTLNITAYYRRAYRHPSLGHRYAFVAAGTAESDADQLLREAIWEAWRVAC